MVGAAAATHRPLVEHTQPGSGLAGIQDRGLGSGDCIHIAAGEGGDAAHALHDVQDHALTGENHAGIMHDDRNGLSFAQAYTVENLGIAGDIGMRGDRPVQRGENIEHAWNATQSGENAILLGEDGRRSPLVYVNAGIRGGVAGGAIFLQRALQNCSDSAA